jgi:dienelactone hydrolase
MLGGSEGGLSPDLIARSALLASHGYTALALAYFGLPSLPATLANIPLEYFGEAIDWMQAHPAIRGDRLAVYGLSRGGDLALLLGVNFPALSVIVSVVGSGQVIPGTGGGASWTYRGTPFPVANPGAGPGSRAVIPVEQIKGPVLLVSAEDDYVWPSAALSQIAADRLAQAGRPYPDQHLRYPKAGHWLWPPYFPTFDSTFRIGGTPQGNAAARADFWPRVLALLDEHLRR